MNHSEFSSLTAQSAASMASYGISDRLPDRASLARENEVRAYSQPSVINKIYPIQTVNLSHSIASGVRCQATVNRWTIEGYTRNSVVE